MKLASIPLKLLSITVLGDSQGPLSTTSFTQVPKYLSFRRENMEVAMVERPNPKQ